MGGLTVESVEQTGEGVRKNSRVGEVRVTVGGAVVEDGIFLTTLRARGRYTVGTVGYSQGNSLDKLKMEGWRIESGMNKRARD